MVVVVVMTRHLCLRNCIVNHSAFPNASMLQAVLEHPCGQLKQSPKQLIGGRTSISAYLHVSYASFSFHSLIETERKKKCGGEKNAKLKKIREYVAEFGTSAGKGSSTWHVILDTKRSGVRPDSNDHCMQAWYPLEEREHWRRKLFFEIFDLFTKMEVEVSNMSSSSSPHIRCPVRGMPHSRFFH